MSRITASSSSSSRIMVPVLLRPLSSDSNNSSLCPPTPLWLGLYKLVDTVLHLLSLLPLVLLHLALLHLHHSLLNIQQVGTRIPVETDSPMLSVHLLVSLPEGRFNTLSSMSLSTISRLTDQIIILHQWPSPIISFHNHVTDTVKDRTLLEDGVEVPMLQVQSRCRTRQAPLPCLCTS